MARWTAGVAAVALLGFAIAGCSSGESDDQRFTAAEVERALTTAGVVGVRSAPLDDDTSQRDDPCAAYPADVFECTSIVVPVNGPLGAPIAAVWKPGHQRRWLIYLYADEADARAVAENPDAGGGFGGSDAKASRVRNAVLLYISDADGRRFQDALTKF
jgi:hypothetical protein